MIAAPASARATSHSAITPRRRTTPRDALGASTAAAGGPAGPRRWGCGERWGCERWGCRCGLQVRGAGAGAATDAEDPGGWPSVPPRSPARRAPAPTRPRAACSAHRPRGRGEADREAARADGAGAAPPCGRRVISRTAAAPRDRACTRRRHAFPKVRGTPPEGSESPVSTTGSARRPRNTIESQSMKHTCTSRFPKPSRRLLERDRPPRSRAGAGMRATR